MDILSLGLKGWVEPADGEFAMIYGHSGLG
jgi:hypothetical protein